MSAARKVFAVASIFDHPASSFNFAQTHFFPVCCCAQVAKGLAALHSIKILHRGEHSQDIT